ncbi:MAG: CshA/CshB family fibrillar adhesin-related protein [Aeromicrobium sp.]|uniref:CshA/CshB family fibrillar adhesin-related protein n=1 Tax=Aeromicrobium sp. TaxID=1871063 RepID=UPI0039E3924D
MKKALATAAVTALVGVGLAVTAVAPAEARYADGGAGQYKGEIDWIEWGETTTPVQVDEGYVGVSERELGTQTLGTYCTVSDISTDNTDNHLLSYAPGQYGGDGFDDMYNIGGTGTDNELISGLSNVDDGGAISASLDCESYLFPTDEGSTSSNRVQVPITGLVVSEGEASNSGEGYEVTPTGSGSYEWSLIDGYANCNDQPLDVTRTDDTLRVIAPDGRCGSGPALVAYAQGASSLDFTINPDGVDGRTAITLGVVLPVDFGDAPTSYDVAGAVFSPTFSGGTELTDGVTQQLMPATVDGDYAVDYADPVVDVRLGDEITGDSSYVGNAAADGDTAGDDGVTLDADPIPTARGGSYTLSDVSCTGGVVQGWIDWNLSGAFDAGEGSGTVSCADASSVDLTWTIPDDAVQLFDDAIADSYLRVRIGADEDAVSSPTGISTSGEVEDYAVELGVDPDPQLEIVKSAQLNDANGNGTADEGETIVYSFTVRNTGNLTLQDVTVVDAKVSGLTPESVALLSAEGDPEPPSESVAGPVEFTADPYTVTAADVAAGAVTNVAVATGTTLDGDAVTSAEATVSTVTTVPAALPTTGLSTSQALLLSGLLAGVMGTLALRLTRRRASVA